MNLPQSALYTPRDQYLISKNAFIYQMHLHFIGGNHANMLTALTFHHLFHHDLNLFHLEFHFFLLNTFLTLLVPDMLKTLLLAYLTTA